MGSRNYEVRSGKWEMGSRSYEVRSWKFKGETEEKLEVRRELESQN